MALTATLALDIQNWEKNLKKAEVELQTFERASKTMNRDLKRMLEDFSGQKVAVEASRMAEAVSRIGGASKLTEAEQRRVNAVVSEAIAKYRVLGQEAPKALRDLADATRAAQQPLISVSNLIQGAVAGAAAAATAGLMRMGQALLQFGADSVARGNQLVALRQSFIALGGGADQAGDRLQALRRGSMGLVDDLALMQSANKSMLLGLNLSVGQMEDLAKTATVLGRAMGQDATASLNDLITALGRSSPMILDNLGLSVKVGEANEAYARALGKTASALTDAEKKQAFMNAAMEVAREKVKQLGDIQLTAAEHGSKLWTQIKNLADATGGFATNNVVVMKSLSDTTRAMETLATAIREGPTKAIKQYNDTLIGALPNIEKANLLFLQQGSLSRGPGLTGDALFSAMQKVSPEEFERLAKAIEHANKVAAARDGLFGSDTIARANILIAALGDVKNISKLTESAQEHLREEVLKALAVYLALGKDAPHALLLIRDATSKQLLPSIDFTQQAFERLKATVGDLPSRALTIWADLKHAIEEAKPGTKWTEAWKGMKAGLEEVLQDIPGTLVAAFTGGGDIMGAVRAIASQIGSTIGGEIGKAFGGKWGEKIGEAVGALAGLLVDGLDRLFTGRPVHEDIARRVAGWAGPISEGLSKAIAETTKQFRGSRLAAEIFSLSDIIGDVGGLNADNLAGMTAKLRDVFVMLQSGGFTSAQAVKVLDENWRAFVDAGTDGSGRLSAGLREIIDLYRRTGLQSKELTGYLQEQARAALDGLSAVIAGQKNAFDHYAAIAQRVKDAAGNEAALTAALKEQFVAAEGARGSLAALSVQALASFNAALAQGIDYFTALQQISPALAQLTEAYANLGINIDNAALAALTMQNTILQGNPALMQGLSGLIQQMVALDNLGLLNAETFEAMSKTAAEMYTQLQAEVAKAGGTTKDALLPMQQYLREAAEQAELLGIPLDATTQMLIDQSKELGIWKDKGKDGATVITDAVKDLVASIKDLIAEMRGIPTDIKTTVTTSYQTEGTPPPGGAPGPGGESPSPSAGFGPGLPAVSPGAAAAAMQSAGSATIRVPVYLDGFQIAMATAPHRNAANRRWGV